MIRLKLTKKLCKSQSKCFVNNPTITITQIVRYRTIEIWIIMKWGESFYVEIAWYAMPVTKIVYNAMLYKFCMRIQCCISLLVIYNLNMTILSIFFPICWEWFIFVYLVCLPISRYGNECEDWTADGYDGYVRTNLAINIPEWPMPV